jgi:hypothetical protein
MRQFRLPSLIFVVAFLLSSGFAPTFASAQEATPVIGDDHQVGHDLEVGDEVGVGDDHEDSTFACSEEARQAGARDVKEQPWPGGLVSPASAPGQDLYLVEVTVPSGACVWFDGHLPHDGAIVWYIKSGNIAFGLDLLEGSPPPDVALVGGDGTIKQVTLSMSLTAGDSLSADRAVGYAYRNDGTTDAVILMTVLENRWIWTGAEFSPIPDGMRDCRGICRNSRR